METSKRHLVFPLSLRTLDNIYFLGMIGEKGMVSWDKQHLRVAKIVCMVNSDLL